MDTSKYIHINDKIILEYIYRDTNNVSNSIPTTSTGSRVLKLFNPYINGNYFFNYQNDAVHTGNTIFNSGLKLEDNKYGWLTNNTIIHFIDADSASLGVNLSGLYTTLTTGLNVPINNIFYDKIRLYFTGGYDFNGKDGIILEVALQDMAGQMHHLLSAAYTKNDIQQLQYLNKPIIVNEKLYTNYIEFYIISPSYIIANNNILNQITTNVNIGNPTIFITYKEIYKSEYTGQKYFLYTNSEVKLQLPFTDEYSLLEAYINESEDGDYFELYGKYNGIIYEDFINTLIASGQDIVVVHRIDIFEQIGSSYVLTGQQNFIQTSQFDLPIYFRPVIINAHIAVSYMINYTLQIMNRKDNSQILRTASYVSFNPKKYGKKLTRLNDYSVIENKLYNKLDINNVQHLSDYTLPTQILTQHIPYFYSYEKINIAVTDNSNNENIRKNIDFKKQGNATIYLTDYDNHFIFLVGIETDSGVVPFNLDNSKTIYKMYLKFNDIEISTTNTVNTDFSLQRGYLNFYFSKLDIKKIIKYNKGVFHITSVTDDNEMLLYAGEWQHINYRYSNILIEENIKLKNEIKTITDTNTQLNLQLNNLSNTINILKNKTNVLTDQLNQKIEELKNIKTFTNKLNITLPTPTSTNTSLEITSNNTDVPPPTPIKKIKL